MKYSLYSLPNWHHAEGDVFRRHVICTFYFINFISFGHHYAMVLQDDCVAINTSLKRKLELQIKLAMVIIVARNSKAHNRTYH